MNKNLNSRHFGLCFLHFKGRLCTCKVQQATFLWTFLINGTLCRNRSQKNITKCTEFLLSISKYTASREGNGWISVKDKSFHIQLREMDSSFNTLPFLSAASGRKIPDTIAKATHLRGKKRSGLIEMTLAAAAAAPSPANFRCDVCSKCSTLYPLQPTQYFQHQGILSTSHWWTAPSHIVKRRLHCQSNNSTTSQFAFLNTSRILSLTCSGCAGNNRQPSFPVWNPWVASLFLLQPCRVSAHQH